jgi:hypothetical protein
MLTSAVATTVSASGAAVNFGSEVLTGPGGQYRLCWCAAGYTCSVGEHFNVDVGELRVIGVAHLEQHRTCVAGQTCSIDGIEGQDLSADDTLMVLETCSGNNVIYRFPEASTAVTVTESGASAAWGSTFVSASGGEYRLCWCAAGQECGTNMDVALDIGSFTVVGPHPGQERTCVAGQSCWIDGMRGNYLSDNDQIMVMETCGTWNGEPSTGGARTLPGLPGGGLATEVAAIGTSYHWGDIPVSVAGGRYQLCWCAGGFTCSVPEDFVVTTGSLEVIGPAGTPGYTTWTRTCISGQTCAFKGITGHKLEDGDLLSVLDTCGVGASAGVSGFPTAGMATTSASGGSVSWGTVMTANGGAYRLCWCAAGMACTSAVEFVVDVGEVVVVGPHTQEDRTCVAGQTCTVDRMTGQHLSATDVWLVLDTCGAAEIVPRSLTSGLVVTASGATLSWGTAGITASGGQYRLCWCAGGQSCVTGGDALKDVTGLTILGVEVGTHEYTCVSGQTCTLDGIVGYGLTDSDRIMILETCGTGTVIRGFGNGGDGFGNGGAAVSWSSTGGVASWGTVVISAVGGSYRLCWCGTAMRCSQGTEFVVDAGKVDVVGPTLFVQRTCVSGQTCAIDAIVGSMANSGDQVLMLDTCGVSELVARMPAAGLMSPTATGMAMNWGITPISGPGGAYRLCWCAAGFDCSVSGDFRLDMGELVIIGPSPLDNAKTCVSGQTCLLDGIEGHLLSSSDAVMLLDTCAVEAGSAIHGLPAVGLIAGSGEVLASGTTLTWGAASLVTAVGGLYRLCWCGGGFECTTVDNFRTDFGHVYVVGPSTAHAAELRTCISGQTCFIDALQGRTCRREIACLRWTRAAARR